MMGFDYICLPVVVLYAGARHLIYYGCPALFVVYSIIILYRCCCYIVYSSYMYLYYIYFYL